uniref:Uncharacterized protein n=1 Tax=Fibrocapsa japonica TaxID=94617 RepID=A0A7S2XWQ0_9STRA
MIAGKDGYTMFPGCPIIKDESSMPVIPTMVRNYFTIVQNASGLQESQDKMIRRKSKMVADAVSQPSTARGPKVASRPSSARGPVPTRDVIKINPTLEGRIVCVQ